MTKEIINIKYNGKTYVIPKPFNQCFFGDEPTKMILDIFDAKLKMQIPSGWGSCSLKSYTSSRGTKIIQLPHLSRFMLFSRDACKEPLKTIFEDLTH